MDHPQYDVGQKSTPDDPGGAPAYYVEPPRASRGCFFYGCLFAAIGMVLLVLAGVALVGTGLYFARQYVLEYTAEAPETIPSVTYEKPKLEKLKADWDQFRKDVEAGKECEIVLTADDINALIEEDEDLKGRVFISLKDDEAAAKVSIPIDVPAVGKRYLNGSCNFTVLFQDGEIDLKIHELEVKGKKMPPEMKAQLSDDQFLRKITEEPKNAELLRKIDSIRIEDSKLYIRAKPPKKSGAEEKAESTKEKDDAPKVKDETPREKQEPAKEKP